MTSHSLQMLIVLSVMACMAVGTLSTQKAGAGPQIAVLSAR
jgi:hypothetical protein